MKSRHLFALILIELSVSGILSGCGGSGSSSSNTNTPTAAPSVTSISPTTVAAGASALTLTVNGTGFQSTTTIQVNSAAVPSTYVSSTQMTATVPATQLASGGTLSVVALNGTAGSSTSTSPSLQVTNPVPTLSSAEPTAVYLGTASTVTVTDTGFVPTTTVQINGSARTTTYVSATQVTVTLNAADVASTGSLALTVVNAAPGGGTSSSTSLAVINPVPVISAITPRTTEISLPAATLTITGSNFVPGSSVSINGTAATTTYASATQLSFSLPTQSTAQALSIKVTNPTPGGGSSNNYTIYAVAPAGTPTLSSISPAKIFTGASDTTIQIIGTNFMQMVNSIYVPTTTVYWNSTALTTTSYGYYYSGQQVLYAKVPASLLATAGTASITVQSTAASAASNALSVTIADPPAPTLTSVSPSSAPVNATTAITLSGSNFTARSTVALNGTTIASTYVSSSQITATIPAATKLGNSTLTVTTPAPGGGTSSALNFTTYLGQVNNDMVYRNTDGYLYVSAPASAGSATGNSILVIDPVTGNIIRTIPVGSNPNKLALSSDGTKLFVGLDGAGALAEIDLGTNQVTSQFSLGGGSGIYNPINTAKYLAAVPGAADSIAVINSSSTGVKIYDAGVARTKTVSDYSCSGTGPISFGSSASVLYYDNGSYLCQLSVDSTGVSTQAKYALSTYYVTTLQYDNGRIYLGNGQVFDASAGTLLGTFYADTSTAASGPLVSDATLGLAFFAEGGNYSGSTPQIQVFNESSFVPTGTIPAAAFASNSPIKIVRWGQNGLAVSTSAQIYIFRSALVKDLSSSPSDLGVTLSAPASATTGTAYDVVATITNHGANAAQSATLALTLDSSLIVNSITASTGSCGSGSSVQCNLGNLATNATATVTAHVTPTTAATATSSAALSSISYDPTASNDTATASTTISGSLYGMTPVLTALSPALVQAGTTGVTLTVTGSGFNSGSTVYINGTAATTTYVSATELTASVSDATIANFGWVPVTVSNPTPGGGNAQTLPLTIYAQVAVTANGILYDPYTRKLYATVPSSSTDVTGNTVVAIDPATASVGTPVSIGSEPNVMAETSDGNYLWIGLKGASSLAKFDLLQQSLVSTVPLTSGSGSSAVSIAPTYMATMPGSDTTLAVNASSTWGNWGIFDVSGTTGSFRTNLSGIYDGVNPVFADATHVYAYDSQTSGAEFYRYTVDANGLTQVDGYTMSGMGGFYGGLELANGLVYGTAGGIVDPTGTTPKQVATLSLVNAFGTGSTYAASSAAVAPDPSLQKAFLLLEDYTSNNSSTFSLTRYNLNNYLAESYLDLPASATSSYTWSMRRWGKDGMALLGTRTNGSSTTTPSILLLLRGPFVLPQQLGTNATATLSASSSGTITHGAGNTLLTLTGTGFAPGISVTWNGSERTTHWLSTTSATVAIPASDLASTGSGALVATNPGASASNTLTVPIN